MTWELPGGIHPLENKEQSLLEPLAQAGLPERLILPLSQHIGAPAKPVVSVGDRVLKGQVIAEAGGFVSAPVHASSSGTVVEIGNQTIPHPSGMSGPCIVIETDGKDEWCELNPLEDPDFSKLENDAILQRIQAAGIAGMGGAGFPARVKLAPPPNATIDTLIINGTECEPYITADDILMRQRAKEIIRGVQILAQLLDNPDNVIIGIEDNKPEAIQTMQQALKDLDADKNIKVVTFPTKYPSGGEKQLIWILTGREVPTGGLPANIGVVVQNIGSTEAIYRAVVEGRPLISRFTTVTGEAVKRPRNYEVLLGTPAQYLLDQSEIQEKKASRLIIGGPMMGYTVTDNQVPVVKTTNCLLVPTEKELPTPQPSNPCIRCGICATVCPVSLLPQQLYWYAQSQDHDKLQAHNLMDCIECGCCSFVCPSSIPLVQNYRAAKGEIRQAHQDKVKSDLARERFEARQLRLEKEAEAKEAKRRARREASAAKKAKAAESDSKTTVSDPVKAAMDKAGTDTASTDEQRNKLEKSLASAQKRVKSAEDKIASAESPEQEEKFKAQLENAKLKVEQYEKRIQELDADATVQGTIEKAEAARSGRSDADRVTETISKLEEKLGKLVEELHQAKESGAENIDELQQRVQTWESKLDDARQELSTLEKTDSGNAETDPAALAIAKAKAKAAAMANMDPKEKLAAQVESIKERLEKAKARLADAKANNDENIDAFKAGVEKLETKLKDAQAELGVPETSEDNQSKTEPAAESEAELDPAAQAIAKAKAKAAAMANMDPKEKLAAQVESIKDRLEKARTRLADAEANNDENIDAFKAGVEKLETKLKETEEELSKA